MTQSTSELFYAVNKELTVGELRRQVRTDLEPEQELRLAATEALQRLHQHFEKPRKTAEDRANAQQDLLMLSYWLKDKALRESAQRFDLQVAKELATNPDEKRRYLQVTMPHHRLMRGLPGPRQGA